MVQLLDNFIKKTLLKQFQICQLRVINDFKINLVRWCKAEVMENIDNNKKKNKSFDISFKIEKACENNNLYLN